MITRNLILSSVFLLATAISTPVFAGEGGMHNHNSHSHNESGEVFQAMVKDYLFIQTALAGDNINGVAERARSIEKTSLHLTRSFDPMKAGVDEENAAELKKVLPDLTRAAAELANKKDLESTRTAFGDLSELMIAYGDLVDGDKPQVAYCPMAKKSWMQNGKKITNPYYGSSMLRCGSIVASSH